jgi:hypothetical protein
MLSGHRRLPTLETATGSTSATECNHERQQLLVASPLSSPAERTARRGRSLDSSGPFLVKYDVEAADPLAIVTLRLLSKGATMTDVNDGATPTDNADPGVVVNLEPEPGPDEPEEPTEEPAEPAEEPEEPAEPAAPAEPTERPAARPNLW